MLGKQASKSGQLKFEVKVRLSLLLYVSGILISVKKVQGSSSRAWTSIRDRRTLFQVLQITIKTSTFYGL